MAWKNKNSDPLEIAQELLRNLENREENARLLILGTETPEGYTMRMTCRHPEAVAGIVYNHAIKTGEVNEALAMAETLIKIGSTALILIRQEVDKQKTNN